MTIQTLTNDEGGIGSTDQSHRFIVFKYLITSQFGREAPSIRSCDDCALTIRLINNAISI